MAMAAQDTPAAVATPDALTELAKEKGDAKDMFGERRELRDDLAHRAVDKLEDAAAAKASRPGMRVPLGAAGEKAKGGIAGGPQPPAAAPAGAVPAPAALARAPAGGGNRN